MSAKNSQIGGDHYRKLAIQPMEYALKNNLNYAQANAIKYITRYKDKGGIHDLRKAIHCIELLIQHESEAQSIADVEWPDESRIDPIGQNGNDGLHYGLVLAEDMIIPETARFIVVHESGEAVAHVLRPEKWRGCWFGVGGHRYLGMVDGSQAGLYERAADNVWARVDV